MHKANQILTKTHNKINSLHKKLITKGNLYNSIPVSQNTKPAKGALKN